MPGLNFGVGGGLRTGFGPVKTVAQPSYGSPESYGAGVALGAFGSDLTTPSSGKGMSPKSDTGLFFWIGVASVVGLVILRASLPN